MQVAARHFFVSGGTLPLDSESYVERKADRQLLEFLEAGRYCYVLNSRQVGKSSLSVRTVARLTERGIRTVFIDLTQIGGRNVQAAQWYAGLASEIGRVLGLSSQMLAYFKEKTELSPMQRFFGAIREVVLEEIKTPIVIFIDEIDATRSLPFDTDEFFAGIRECYNRRVQHEPSQRLTFCLLGVAVPNDLIRNAATTPFNIGERVQLQDFSLEEIRAFGQALGPNGERLARRVHFWTNGQPFLTQSVCQEIAADSRIQDEEGVDALVDRLFFGPKSVDTNVNLADVAHRALNDSQEDSDKFRADLLSAYERVWRGGWVKDDDANRVSVVLKLSGLCRSEGGRLPLRNRIYQHVFDRTWIRANMPGQELIRQKISFRRGLMRGIAVTVVLGGIIGTLALFALRARADALEAKSALAQELYIANISSLRLFEETGDSSRMASVLERTKTSPYRGFEWNFWLGRLHDSTEEYTLDYSTPGKQELGILSQDGRQICVEDRLADVAVVVDRKTKRVLGKTALGRNMILATTAGIVAITSARTQATVTDIATGRIVCTMQKPGYVIGGLASQPQSDCVLVDQVKTADLLEHIFEIWDLRTARVVFQYGPIRNTFGPLAISRDGHRIVYAVKQASTPTQNVPSIPIRLFVWDTRANREVDSLPFDAVWVFFGISQSGKVLAYLDENHLARLRDIDRRSTIYSTIGFGEQVPLSIEVAPDDKSMVCVSSDGAARVREVPSGRLLAIRSNLRDISSAGGNLWVGSSSTVRILNLSRGGQGIVGEAKKISRDNVGGLRLTSLGVAAMPRLADPSLTPLPTLTLPNGAHDLTYSALWCIAPSAGDRSKVVSIDGSVPTIEFPYRLDNLTCGVHNDVMVVMDQSRQFLGISGKTHAQLWSRRYEAAIRSIWMSPDSKRLIASTYDGQLATLDPNTGEILRRSKGHKLQITALNFSRDSRLFLTGGGDGKAILWDGDTLAKLAEFRGNTADIESADLSPDGKRVATCNVAGAWQIWDRYTGDQLTEIRASNLPLRSIVFSADGRKLLTAGDDGLVRSWSGPDRDPTVRIPVPSSAVRNISP